MRLEQGQAKSLDQGLIPGGVLLLTLWVVKHKGRLCKYQAYSWGLPVTLYVIFSDAWPNLTLCARASNRHGVQPQCSLKIFLRQPGVCQHACPVGQPHFWNCVQAYQLLQYQNELRQRMGKQIPSSGHHQHSLLGRYPNAWSSNVAWQGPIRNGLAPGSVHIQLIIHVHCSYFNTISFLLWLFTWALNDKLWAYAVTVSRQ